MSRSMYQSSTASYTSWSSTGWPVARRTNVVAMLCVPARSMIFVADENRPMLISVMQGMPLLSSFRSTLKTPDALDVQQTDRLHTRIHDAMLSDRLGKGRHGRDLCWLAASSEV